MQRYLEHIRCLSEQRDGLAQELEKENEQLRTQLEELTLQQGTATNTPASSQPDSRTTNTSYTGPDSVSQICFIAMPHMDVPRVFLVADAQMNEVAEMLYQVGLTEVMPSSPSEQVAYLLVERASLLDREQDPGVNVHAQVLALAQAHSPKDRPGDAEPQSQQATKDNTDQVRLSCFV